MASLILAFLLLAVPGVASDGDSGGTPAVHLESFSVADAVLHLVADELRHLVWPPKYMEQAVKTTK